ncbi:MAG TPA: type II toxin-antitoxin system RelE/ParE family toxin [Tepidisphaeraceae bacterium]|jgi:toxin ParE1/3/4
MAVQLLNPAVMDIRWHVKYLRLHRPSAAAHFARIIDDDLATLAQNPNFGTRLDGLPERLAGIRQWPMSHFINYIIYYRPIESGIEVIRVIHGARDVRRILRKS